MSSPTPLTQLHPEYRDWAEIDRCHICGTVDKAGSKLLVECNEHDQPKRTLGSLVVVCTSKACLKVLDEHPLLYIDAPVIPGLILDLCDVCTFREGRRCTHPGLKANGGEGIVQTKALVRVTTAKGCFKVGGNAVGCAGQTCREDAGKGQPDQPLTE